MEKIFWKHIKCFFRVLRFRYWDLVTESDLGNSSLGSRILKPIFGKWSGAANYITTLQTKTTISLEMFLILTDWLANVQTTINDRGLSEARFCRSNCKRNKKIILITYSSFIGILPWMETVRSFASKAFQCYKLFQVWRNAIIFSPTK